MPDHSQLLLNFPTRPEFNFSNFVLSDGSRIAFDAARNFCSQSETPYQSLFLFGQKNLGKTHLLLSIGNLAAENGTRALYIKGADFCDKISGGDSYQSQQTLKKLMEVDYFLLDDVEALASSVAAQEKLYHIYNTVIEKGGKVAFASYFSPEKIKNAESYLTSRFQWGMLAEIKPIDDNTTAQIIHKLAKDIDLILPENIIDFLLSRIPRDFISLQNAVTVLNQESFVQKKKVTLALVKKALKIP
ncbi:MAG: chromosomal replication initiator protein [Nitrospinales bacterium]|jgi:chromosomal replication initiator protein